MGGAPHAASNPGATEIGRGGTRTPPLQLYERGKLRDDVHALLVLNVRLPRDFRGVLAAMIGSYRVGERRLQPLPADFGSAPSPAAVKASVAGAARPGRGAVLP